MTKESDSKKGTIGLIVAALVLLGAIVFYAFTKTPAQTQNTNGGDSVNNKPTNEQQQEAAAGDAGKLGPNEVSINADNFKAEVEDNKGVVVVDAYAPWCPHCQRISPLLTELSNDYVGRVKFGKMNSDNQDPKVKANFDFAVSNGLTGYPTVWIYKNGTKVTTLSGERTKDQYRDEIEKVLK